MGNHRIGWIGITLTCIKPLYVAAIMLLLIHQQLTLSSLIIALFIVSDIYDGRIFRTSTLARDRRLEKFRRWADVVGDRVAIDAVMIVMTACNGLPFVLYAVEVVREVLLLGLIFLGYWVKNPIQEPNNPSRIATLFVGLAAISWLQVQPVLSVWCVIMIIVFGILGFVRYCQTIFAKKGTEP